MAVTMDPDGLRAGGTAFNRNAEELLGDARTVTELAAALRPAFAGAGESAWPGVEALLSEVAGQLDQAGQGAARAGTVLGNTADGASQIDTRNANTMRTRSFGG